MKDSERIKMLEENLYQSSLKLDKGEITRDYYKKLSQDVNNRIKELRSRK